ncbi:Y-family DNA polymerase [Pedobacter glucosidilyticus]|uniref:Y-family DNA polymerase n=1 Tax=Pedobacter glucosidilyticus TaxID=1122941 RepID=UPI0026EEDB77|nr:DNA polymerase Y family protein [Pedobacter glucosidilyticus]
MASRFLCLYFPYLLANQLYVRKPNLAKGPLAIVKPEQGRRVVHAVNAEAVAAGIKPGCHVADAQALVPELGLVDYQAGKEERLLTAIGHWCIGYSPQVAINPPDSMMLNITGCSHLWGGEQAYIQALLNILKEKGYELKAAIADTQAAAWAVAHFADTAMVIAPGQHSHALAGLPLSALRLEENLLQRFYKLGFKNIASVLNISRQVLRRRFGEDFLLKLGKALGTVAEPFMALKEQVPYQERLPCLEPLRTAKAIAIAIERLLEALCYRLDKEGKGIRKATLSCYRVDGKLQQLHIGTHQATVHVVHLLKLYALRIAELRPGLGIELFVLDAVAVEDLEAKQERLWIQDADQGLQALSELLDRLAVRMGRNAIQRYLPQQHYWPERSVKTASDLRDEELVQWQLLRPRPIHLIARPLPIEVSAPIPDYPPMLFKLNGELHQISKADGPERIEREWWLEAGEHRDYYQVEDQNGKRYWIFRLGHYDVAQQVQWFLHGYFA